MASTSRWADNDEDKAFEAQRKREKEEKKRVKAEKQRLAAEEAQSQNEAARSRLEAPLNGLHQGERPSKRRRLSIEARESIARETTAHETTSIERPIQLLRLSAPDWGPCRHVDNFEKLNHIEEGSYGWVSRAREVATGEVVALKKLKIDHLNDGFPVTGLREIQTLMDSRHENIVRLREVVMGDSKQEYVERGHDTGKR